MSFHNYIGTGRVFIRLENPPLLSADLIDFGSNAITRFRFLSKILGFNPCFCHYEIRER